MQQKTNNQFDDFEIEEEDVEGEYEQNTHPNPSPIRQAQGLQREGNISKPLFSDLPRRQKIAVISLALFSIVFLGAWAVNFKKSIYGPLAKKSTVTNSTAFTDVNSDEALRLADTDKDGLSDYDEKNIYNTSPYLSDSDGDSILDKAEIDAGTDPNCPTGRDCTKDGLFSPETKLPTATVNSKDISPNQSQSLNPAITGTTTRPLTNEEKAQVSASLGEKVDPKTLRNMLLSAGMQQEILDKLTDDDLLKSYQEVIK